MPMSSRKEKKVNKATYNLKSKMGRYKTAKTIKTDNGGRIHRQQGQKHQQLITKHRTHLVSMMLWAT